MNYSYKTIILSVLILTLNACIFLPKIETPNTDDNNTCHTATSEWSIEVIPLVGSNSHCHNEICAGIFIGVPLLVAAVTIPIVVIGNTLNYVERQFSCD